MEIESRKCINIRKIIEYPTTDVATKLPQTNAVTGCDTTSFLHGAPKNLKFLKVSSWTRKGQTSKHNWCFMQSFRSSSFKDVEKFIQTVYYSGKEEQSLTETRVRLY